MDEVLAVEKYSCLWKFQMHVSVVFFTKAKIEIIQVTIADITFRQNYGKLGQEFMTNKIGVQWKNKPDPTLEWNFTSFWKSYQKILAKSREVAVQTCD